MGALDISNLQHCTINIHFHGSTEELQVTNSNATEVVSNNLGRRWSFGSQQENESNLEHLSELNIQPASTKHPSESYFVCYENSNSNCSPIPSRNIFSRDSGLGSLDSDSENEPEHEYQISFSSSLSRNYHGSFPQRQLQNGEVQEEETRNASYVPENSSSSESSEPYKNEKIGNEKKEEHRISENGGISSEEKEPSLLKLNDVTEMNPDLEPISQQIPDNIAETCNYLQFSSCIGETGGSMPSDLDESCETFHKEVASGHTRQFQDLLKDAEEVESYSYTTGYPATATWLSNYQREYSSDTESDVSKTEEKIMPAAFDIVFDTSENIDKVDEKRCSQGTELIDSHEADYTSFEKEIFNESAAVTNKIILDKSFLDKDDLEWRQRCKDNQLKEADCTSSYLFVRSQKRAIDDSLIDLDYDDANTTQKKEDLIDLDYDDTNTTQKKEDQSTGVKLLEEIEKSFKLKYVDILLIAGLENLDEFYQKGIAGGESQNKLGKHSNSNFSRAEQTSVSNEKTATETDLISVLGLGLNRDTSNAKIKSSDECKKFSKNADKFEPDQLKDKQRLYDKDKGNSREQSDVHFELPCNTCDSLKLEKNDYNSETDAEISGLIFPACYWITEKECDIDAVSVTVCTGFSDIENCNISSDFSTSRQSDTNESSYACQWTSPDSFSLEMDGNIFQSKQSSLKLSNGTCFTSEAEMCPEIGDSGCKVETEQILNNNEVHTPFEHVFSSCNSGLNSSYMCPASIESKPGDCYEGAISHSLAGSPTCCELKKLYQEYSCEQCVECFFSCLQVTCQIMPEKTEIYADAVGQEGEIMSPMHGEIELYPVPNHRSGGEEHSESMRSVYDSSLSQDSNLSRTYLKFDSCETSLEANSRDKVMISCVESSSDGSVFSSDEKGKFKLQRRKVFRKREKTKTNRSMEHKTKKSLKIQRPDTKSDSCSSVLIDTAVSKKAAKVLKANYRNDRVAKSSAPPAGSTDCDWPSSESSRPPSAGDKNGTVQKKASLKLMSGFKQTIVGEPAAEQSRCNYCNILLSIPNAQCKRHKPTRVPFSEEIKDFEDNNSRSNMTKSNCLKNGELGQTTNFADSGIGSGQNVTGEISNHTDDTFQTHVISPEYQTDFKNAIFKTVLNKSRGIGSRFNSFSYQKRKKSECYKTGLNLKFKKYQRKVLKKTFSNKSLQHMKSLVREIHVEHRHIPVFGLGSYFDRLNNGLPPTVQEQMQYEWLRLASFSNYTGNGNALALSRNGFYHDHTAGPTSTRCFLCEARHSDWEMFDDIGAEHRRRSPNCPFHGNRDNESLNVSITYGESQATPRSSLPSSASGSASSSVTSSNAPTSAAVTEVTRSLETTHFSHAQSGSSGGESISHQPTEDPESGDRSLLALAQPRTQRAHGRTGHSFSTIIASRRNNVATGARSNVGIEPSRSGTSTPGTPSQLPGLRTELQTPVHTEAHTPVRTEAQTPVRTEAQTSVSTATEALQGSSAALPAPAPTSGSEQATAGPGGGGRPDPTSTVVVDNPKHPDYINIDTRISSYQGFPDYLDQTPRQMSEAGFFFVGVADFTRCFCCGGGLRNWEPGDDPMLEHTRWFPRCEYVNKLKGERYVAAVQRRHQEHMAEQQRQQIELAERRDENRNPPDPMTTDAAAVMREMGYSVERTREAILAVRGQTGSSVVTTQQVLTWLLDEEDRRSRANAALGIRPPGSIASSTPSVVNTSIPSSIVYTGTSIASSIMYTGTSIGTSIVNTTSSMSAATSIVNAGTTTSTVNSTSTASTAKVQQTSETGNQQTGTSQTGAMSSSSSSSGGGSVEKQSGASGGDSDESKSKTTGETTSSETSSKAAKKKSAKKKAKSKAGTKSETTGATGGGLDAKSLKAENEKLREMQTCKICMEQPVNTTLLPCGHLVCCNSCASRLQRCPICRKRIKGTVKTFMS